MSSQRLYIVITNTQNRWTIFNLFKTFSMTSHLHQLKSRQASSQPAEEAYRSEVAQDEGAKGKQVAVTEVDDRGRDRAAYPLNVMVVVVVAVAATR